MRGDEHLSSRRKMLVKLQKSNFRRAWEAAEVGQNLFQAWDRLCTLQYQNNVCVWGGCQRPWYQPWSTTIMIVNQKSWEHSSHLLVFAKIMWPDLIGPAIIPGGSSCLKIALWSPQLPATPDFGQINGWTALNFWRQRHRSPKDKTALRTEKGKNRRPVKLRSYCTIFIAMLHGAVLPHLPTPLWNNILVAQIIDPSQYQL